MVRDASFRWPPEHRKGTTEARSVFVKCMALMMNSVSSALE